MVAQSVVIDLPQTILLEGDYLTINVISDQVDDAIIGVNLLDKSGNLVAQHIINPSTEVSQYSIQIPKTVKQTAWVEIVNGDQSEVEELYILKRPIEIASNLDQLVLGDGSRAQMQYKQNETVCIDSDLQNSIYLSVSDQLFGGAMIQLDNVMNTIHHPFSFDQTKAGLTVVLDESTMRPARILQSEDANKLKISSSDAGSKFVVVDRLSNQQIPFTQSKRKMRSAQISFTEKEENYLANQLLITEILSPAMDYSQSQNARDYTTTDWSQVLTRPSIDVNPKEYVNFDKVEAFIDEVVKNLRIYTSDAGVVSSYVYPVQTSPSIRQPLYLLNGQVSSIDQILSMDQSQIERILVYTDVKSLTTNLGPVASAGLVMVYADVPLQSENRLVIGHTLSTRLQSTHTSPLDIIPLATLTLSNCYQHNERIGNFEMRLVSKDENGMKISKETHEVISRDVKE